MSQIKIKQETLEEEYNGNKSWLDALDEMESELSSDSDKIKEEFRSNCDNATFDFGIDQESANWQVKQELDENTNDSVRSITSESRKRDRKSAFKRRAPYDVPAVVQQPTASAEPPTETSTLWNDK